jgi:pyrroline-5-carboxylate reductase
MANTIGLIGCGNMGRALALGLLATGKHQRTELIASDADASRRQALSSELGIEVVADNRAVVAKAAVLVLAVKPQIMTEVLKDLASAIAERHLLISIAAGVTTRTLEQQLGGKVRVVRAMPNLPAIVAAGATALAAGAHATASDVEQAQALFESVGRTVVVSEAQMDAVTGLSGSGPAYAMLVIEGLADGGVQMGLPRAVALLLATQTVYGASKLLLETGEHPGQLKDRVASPGGTTIAGIDALEQGGVRHTMMNAVKAATERAQQLGAGQSTAGQPSASSTRKG